MGKVVTSYRIATGSLLVNINLKKKPRRRPLRKQYQYLQQYQRREDVSLRKKTLMQVTTIHLE